MIFTAIQWWMIIITNSSFDYFISNRRLISLPSSFWHGLLYSISKFFKKQIARYYLNISQLNVRLGILFQQIVWEGIIIK